MSTYRPIAKVRLVEAMLFVAPDGQDRDLDLKNSDDVAAVRSIRAVDYIEARDSEEKPDWMKASHRLYCPCCLEKGHLSRQSGYKASARNQPTWNHGHTMFDFPERFQKHSNEDAKDHTPECEHFVDRTLRVHPRSVDGHILEADKHLRTITISTSAPLVKPPRPVARTHNLVAEASAMAREEKVTDGTLDAQNTAPITKAPPLNSIKKIASLIEERIYYPEAWAEKDLFTRNGARALADIFVNSNRGAFDLCKFRPGEDAIISRLPNRRGDFWEFDGEVARFPSHPSGGPPILYRATEPSVKEKLKDLFGRARWGTDERVLAYGPIDFIPYDGRVEIFLHRTTQFMAWKEPQMLKPKMSDPSEQFDLFTF